MQIRPVSSLFAGKKRRALFGGASNIQRGQYASTPLVSKKTTPSKSRQNVPYAKLTTFASLKKYFRNREQFPDMKSVVEFAMHFEKTPAAMQRALRFVSYAFLQQLFRQKQAKRVLSLKLRFTEDGDMDLLPNAVQNQLLQNYFGPNRQNWAAKKKRLLKWIDEYMTFVESETELVRQFVWKAETVAHDKEMASEIRHKIANTTTILSGALDILRSDVSEY